MTKSASFNSRYFHGDRMIERLMCCGLSNQFVGWDEARKYHPGPPAITEAKDCLVAEQTFLPWSQLSTAVDHAATRSGARVFGFAAAVWSGNQILFKYAFAIH